MAGRKSISGILKFTLLPAFLFGTAESRILEVGVGKTYAKPSAVAGIVKDGDTVLIAPGIYEADVATWSANNLVLKASAPYAHLKANGANARGKGTWVITGDNCKVENIEFSGASVPDENGAGIRQEGNNLTITRCYFHDNENGILTDGGKSEIVIEYSEFARNGLGDGYTHNMYIGDVSSFILRHCYTHHAKIGHNIKSRAAVNQILYNRSSGDADGTASYELDLPNGGTSYVIGNVFQQGDATDNPALISYGAEGLTHPGKDLYIINNTFINDRSGGGTGVGIAAGATAILRNNLYTGAGKLYFGTADTAGNLTAAGTIFVNKAGGDYRPSAGSAAIDKGKAPGKAGAYDLAPAFEYVQHAGARARAVTGATLDIGAFEFTDGSPVRPRESRGVAPAKGGRDSGKGATRKPVKARFYFKDGSEARTTLGRREE